MALLRERLGPLAPFPLPAEGGREIDPLWVRYADLLKLGYSAETSVIVAESSVALDNVTSLLVPELAVG